MVGKRQHYVPRLLQRGFLIREAGDGERVWLHRRGVAAKPVGIADIGVEDWFYSPRPQPGEQTLDDIITQLEGDLGATIGAYRATDPATSVDADRAAFCVTHLMTRTKHIRDVMALAVERMTELAADAFTQPDELGALLGLDGDVLSQPLLDAIRKSAAEYTPLGLPAALSERIISYMLRENAAVFLEQVTNIIAGIIPGVRDSFKPQIRDLHKGILESPPPDEGWQSRLSKFNWTVEAGQGLILPDAVALTAVEDGRIRPFMFSSARETCAVLMPVSPTRMLVGRTTPSLHVPFSEFNHQAAAASQMFFIAQSSMDKDGLAEEIGNSTYGEIREAISEAFESLKPSGARTAPLIARREVSPGLPPSYSLKLQGFGDDVLTERFVEFLRPVVGTLSEELPLHDLDGITLAFDYLAAVAELEREDASSPSVQTEPNLYGWAVAKAISVNREGAVKTHVVFDADHAFGWLSDDHEQRVRSVHTLVMMLGHVADRTLFAKTTEFTFNPDSVGRVLHPLVAHVASDWFASRAAAFVDPSAAMAYADLVLEGLDRIRAAVSEAAQAGCVVEFQSALSKTFSLTSSVMSHAAKWLGHRNGLPIGTQFCGSDLAEKLEGAELNLWLEMFGRDLSRVYSDDGLDLDVLVRLSRHAERLLWSVRLFGWNADGEDRWAALLR